MKSGKYNNPTRRNRNIGTAISGRGNDNKMVIPDDPWADGRVYYERLANPAVIPCEVGNHVINILIEPTKKGYFHACTPDDISRLLRLFDIEHIRDIRRVILRQPKKKEEMLNPVWGRLSYWADLKKHSGSAVFLDAQKMDLVLKWNKSLSPTDTEELNRLKDDGYEVSVGKRDYTIKASMESIRKTQLFRTIPHEIGHYVHYVKFVENKIEGITDEDQVQHIKKSYFNKAREERERFAHKYAEEFYKTNSEKGLIPFDRISDDE